MALSPTSSHGSSGSVGGTALLTVVRNTTGGTKSSNSVTQADVDATNSVFTFTAPASGNVLIRVTFTGGISTGSQNGLWGLREAAANVYGPVDASLGATATATFAIVSATALITGLVAASSHTYKLAFSVTNIAASMSVFQSTADPVTFEVWSAP